MNNFAAYNLPGQKSLGQLVSPPILETPNGTIPLRYEIEQVPEDSDGQVAATINRMSQYVCADCQAGPILYDAQCAVILDPNDPLAGVHRFVRSRLRFVNDEAITQPFDWMLPKGGGQDYFVECLTRPVDVSLQYAATRQPVEGDCDDYSMYTAALLRALGIDCAFATVAANRENPEVYSHVYVATYWRGQRIPMDCSHGQQAGWEFAAPGSGYKYCEWPIYDRQSYGLVGIAIAAGLWFAWKNRKELGEFFS